MGFTSQNGERLSLLKEIKSNRKWNKTHLKKFSIIFGILFILVIVFYLWYPILTQTENEQVSDVTIKKKNPLHIASVASTNNDYLKQCAPQVKCDPNAKYRSINGSCNNLVISTWGAAETPFLRMLDANYSDGYNQPRKQTNGSALPSERVVDLKLFMGREEYRLDENNVLLMPFAQLIAHDISGLPNDVPRNEKGGVIDCCLNENGRKNYPQCKIVVELPADDPVYGPHNITCMPAIRSLTSANYSCPLHPTTYMNTNTQFIDASQVYGSNETVARRLRLMEGGRLNFSTGDHGQMFCPFQPYNLRTPLTFELTNIQYDTGDPANGNQNLGITAIQTLFLRFHNFIAFKLSSINPDWSDEMLYQESRRIVIATIQKIAYEDLLPIIIGDDYQEAYGLNEENIYDPAVISASSQEMSSAAFRVLHAIIPVQFNFINADYQKVSSINVTDWMLIPDLLHKGDNFDQLLRGFLETSGRVSQPSYNFYISNYMLSVPHAPRYTGRDLLVHDMARGRDVGLQPYNQVRHLCGFPLAKRFEDLVDLIHIRDIKKLKDLYRSVDDIDLLAGLLLEKLSNGAIVGPTTRCLIADGFYRFKAGDRFFYDVQGQPGSFSSDQLKVIKKITLSHVICAISNVDDIQEAMFKKVDHNLFPTSKLKCDDVYYLDFDEWNEPNKQQEL